FCRKKTSFSNFWNITWAKTHPIAKDILWTISASKSIWKLSWRNRQGDFELIPKALDRYSTSAVVFYRIKDGYYFSLARIDVNENHQFNFCFSVIIGIYIQLKQPQKRDNLQLYCTRLVLVVERNYPVQLRYLSTPFY